MLTTKRVIYMMMFVGSLVGSYLPVLWGADVFSGASLLLGFIGAVAGVFGGYKLAQIIGAE